MRVVSSPEASECLDRIDAWWRAHRDKNPNLFDDEVQRVVALLPGSPYMGHVYRVRRGVAFRRVLLERTHHYLYYWVDEESPVIEVVSIWGTPIEGAPPL
jgi:plasmid stabilization system protein ParE